MHIAGRGVITSDSPPRGVITSGEHFRVVLSPAANILKAAQRNYL